MASNDPNAAGAPSRRPRTPPTLDLKAQELKSEPVAGANPSSEPAKDSAPKAPEPGAATPAEPKAAAQPAAPASSAPLKTEPSPAASSPAASKPDANGKPGTEGKAAPPAKPTEAKPAETKTEDAKPAGAKVGADAKPATGASSVPPSGKADAKAGPAPQKSRSGAGTVAAALVLALLAGGGAGGGLAYYLIHHQPAAPTVDLAPLTQRLAALEARPAADPKAFTALAGRVEKLEASLAQASGALAALKAAPAATPAAAGPDLAPQLDALKSALAKAETTTQTALGTLDARVTALKGAEETLQAGQESLKAAVAAATVAAQQAQGLGPRIDLMGARIDEARKEALKAADAAAATNRAAASLVVLGSLKAAVETGRPFAPELAAAQALLGPQAAALEPFAKQAAAGFPTLAKLADTLAATGNGALDALTPVPEAAPADASLVTRFLSSAQSLVKIRPADGPDVEAARSALDRAVLAVRTGDIATAASLLRQMPPAVAAKVAPVAEQLEARLRAVQATATLYQQSLAAISGKAP